MALAYATVLTACGPRSATGPRPIAYSALPAPTAPAAAPGQASAVARAQTPDAPFRAQPPAPTATAPFVPPRIEEFRLTNGIRVLLVERRELPIVEVRYLTHRGGDDVPAARAGLASLVGTLLEQGTTNRSAIELSDAFAALGAEHSAWVGWDTGGAAIKVLAPNLEPALALLADVVEHPAFSPEEIERARARRLAALRQERDAPRIVASNVAARVIYGEGYPYGHTESGTEQAVRAITRADIVRFYHTHFVPTDSALVVVGDVTRASVGPLLERAFGAWRARAPATRPLRAPEPVTSTPRIFLVDRPGAPQSAVVLGQIGVSRSSQDYAALVVMNTILGGMFSSRINLNLREAHAYTYGARSGFAFRRGAGPFAVGAAVVAEHTADAVRETLAELSRMRTSDVTEGELAAAKADLTESLPARFETVGQAASAVADLIAWDLPLDEYATIAARISAVTAADVRRVAEHYLDPDHARIIVVGDRSTVEPGLRALGLGDVEIRDATGARPGTTPALPPSVPPPGAPGRPVDTR